MLWAKGSLPIDLPAGWPVLLDSSNDNGTGATEAHAGVWSDGVQIDMEHLHIPECFMFFPER